MSMSSVIERPASSGSTSLEHNRGFRRHELNHVRQMIAEHLLQIIDAWEQHCG